jgi:hypothetical protein
LKIKHRAVPEKFMENLKEIQCHYIWYVNRFVNTI